MYLKRSCCCYSLPHGAIIIGIAVMVCSAVGLLTEIGMIAEWQDIKESLKNPKMQQCERHLKYYGCLFPLNDIHKQCILSYLHT
jgi:hypothetical protein